MTYSDMITLLVAFFMMMYSMSVLNLEKFKQAAIGIRSGFNGSEMGDKRAGESLIEKGNPPSVKLQLPEVAPKPATKPEKKTSSSGEKKTRSSGFPPGGDRSEKQSERAKRIGELTSKINQRLAAVAGAKSAARVLPENKGVAIELVGDLIFFPQGSAELSEEAKKILTAVAGVLCDLPNEVSAEGHADALPESGFSSWELSTSRATQVIKFLLKAGNIDPKRVSVTGYGKYRPVSAKTKVEPAATIRNDLVRIFIYQD